MKGNFPEHPCQRLKQPYRPVVKNHNEKSHLLRLWTLIFLVTNDILTQKNLLILVKKLLARLLTSSYDNVVYFQIFFCSWSFKQQTLVIVWVTRVLLAMHNNRRLKLLVYINGGPLTPIMFFVLFRRSANHLSDHNWEATE